MNITITQEDVLATIKPVTKATTEDWGNAIRSLVTTIATIYAFLYASGQYIKYVYKNPLKAYAQVNSGLASQEQLEPIDEALPLPLTVVPEVEVTPTPTKRAPRTRSRKRTAKGAANTTPAVVA